MTLGFSLNSKEPPLFKSGLTKALYRNFINDLVLDRKRQSSPFVYVDSNVHEIRYLAELVGGKRTSEGTLALSIGNQGDIEILTTE